MLLTAFIAIFLHLAGSGCAVAIFMPMAVQAAEEMWRKGHPEIKVCDHAFKSLPRLLKGAVALSGGCNALAAGWMLHLGDEKMLQTSVKAALWFWFLNAFCLVAEACFKLLTAED